LTDKNAYLEKALLKKKLVASDTACQWIKVLLVNLCSYEAINGPTVSQAE
jgi:hypothetical protein